jgi:tetratricopeptide (TPR) repeat protein
MFNTNFVTQLMEQSLSDKFLSQLVAGYLKIQKEEFSEAKEHFTKMLFSPHNPSDDDILLVAMAHIYKKLGKNEESRICIGKVEEVLGDAEPAYQV